eukprot:7778502-Lingulodinium_polyedra.AAC.1
MRVCLVEGRARHVCKLEQALALLALEAKSCPIEVLLVLELRKSPAGARGEATNVLGNTLLSELLV